MSRYAICQKCGYMLEKYIEKMSGICYTCNRKLNKESEKLDAFPIFQFSLDDEGED